MVKQRERERMQIRRDQLCHRTIESTRAAFCEFDFFPPNIETWKVYRRIRLMANPLLAALSIFLILFELFGTSDVSRILWVERNELFSSRV